MACGFVLLIGLGVEQAHTSCARHCSLRNKFLLAAAINDAGLLKALRTMDLTHSGLQSFGDTGKVGLICDGDMQGTSTIIECGHD